MKKASKQLKRFEEHMSSTVGKFAVYPRSYGEMIPLAECILFDEESKAQWHCIINKEYKYIQIRG